MIACKQSIENNASPTRALDAGAPPGPAGQRRVDKINGVRIVQMSVRRETANPLANRALGPVSRAFVCKSTVQSRFRYRHFDLITLVTKMSAHSTLSTYRLVDPFFRPIHFPSLLDAKPRSTCHQTASFHFIYVAIQNGDRGESSQVSRQSTFQILST